jgi:hypothetical protein
MRGYFPQLLDFELDEGLRRICVTGDEIVGDARVAGDDRRLAPVRQAE